MLSDTIEIRDKVTQTLNSIINNLDKSIGKIDEINNKSVDGQEFVQMKENINAASKAIDELLGKNTKKVNGIVNISDLNFGNIVDQSVMLNREMNGVVKTFDKLLSTQEKINSTSIKFVSSDSKQSLDILLNRLDVLKNNLKEIKDNPAKVNFDISKVQSLKERILECTKQQNNLNSAIRSGDTGIIKTSFEQLNRTIRDTELFISNNKKQQRQFKQEVDNTISSSYRLGYSLKNIMSTLLAAKGIKDTINISDDLSSVRARLDNCNDGLQDTNELMTMLKAVSNDTRADMLATGSTIAKLATNAQDSFASLKEVYSFTSLINKALVAGGASAEEQKSALLQLSQGMASGQLQGDEFRSISENAPMILQYVANYLGKTRAEVKELSSDGAITADVIKAAVFKNADDIESKFEKMPYTWGQAMTIFKNDALEQLEPLLNKISELANNDDFKDGLQSILSLFVILADVGVSGIDLIAKGAKTVKDNFEKLEPVLLAIVGCYVAYQAATFGVATAKAVETQATYLQITAQKLLNGEKLTGIMLSNLVVLAIAAVIAAVYLTVNAVNKATGQSIDAFGVIVGALNVVKVEFQNCANFIMNVFDGMIEVNKAGIMNVLIAFKNLGKDIRIHFNSVITESMKLTLAFINLLNKIPRVNIDTTGIQGMINYFEGKTDELKSGKMKYESLTNAFINGFGNRDMVTIKDAYDQGYNSAIKLKEKLKNIVDPNQYDDILKDLDKIIEEGKKTSANTKDTAKNTRDITKTDVKYLNELFKQQIDNRVTKVQINNNVVPGSGATEYREQLNMAKMLAEQSKQKLNGTLKKVKG